MFTVLEEWPGYIIVGFSKEAPNQPHPRRLVHDGREWDRGGVQRNTNTDRFSAIRRYNKTYVYVPDSEEAKKMYRDFKPGTRSVE